ncbi:MAG: peptidylprolyl isomerase [Chloroflexota bacterium]
MAKKKSRSRSSGTGTTSVKKRRQEEQARKKAQQNRMIMIGGGVLAVAVIAFVLWQVLGGSDSTTAGGGAVLDGERPLAALSPSERNAYYSAPPEMIIDTSKDYEAVIALEKGGEMRLRLFDDEAPVTVNNFVFLATQGFYDGVTFHRVIPDFMAQGGDPSGTGGGGPGYQFEDEVDTGLAFDKRGLLAMANAGPATNGSQFFITFVPTPHLNGLHTIFGEIIEGDDVLSNITLVQGGATPDVISRIDIVEQ